MKNITYILLLFFAFLSLDVVAQPLHIVGQVVDGQSQEPLAFATVVFNHNPLWAVMTDIDGRFTFHASQAISSVSSSYIGYTAISAEVKAGQTNLRLEMQPSVQQLDELWVPLSENPANAIIRKVLLNKDRNNPEKINAFRYTSYNKVVVDIKSLNRTDTVALKAKLQGANLFLMESVSERKFLAPDWSEEVIKATRVSGLKNPTFAALATDLQPFSFYREHIELLNVHYLNPISKGTLTKYRFTLEDSWAQGGDTVHLISFRPLPNKNFEGLKGVLYVNTNQFALQNVIATPFQKGDIDLKIQQQYAFVAGKYWFPEQLNYTVIWGSTGGSTENIVAEGKSYIDQVQVDLPLEKKEFGNISLQMDPDANQRDTAFWERYRRAELSTSEIKTYAVIDSIGKKHHFDALLNSLEKTPSGKIGFKYWDLDFSKMLMYNQYEGWRLGFGAYTNESVFKKVILGGFVGYGLRDYQWKYGGEVIYKGNAARDFTVGASYQNNLTEVDKHEFDLSEPTLINLRNYMAYRLDQVEETRLNLGFRMWRYTQWHLSLLHARITPKYLLDTPVEPFEPYNNTQLSVHLRYAYKEKLIHTGKQHLSMGTAYPVFYLSYSRGLEGVFDGSLAFNKVEAAVEQSFFLKNIGKTSYRVEAGYVDTALPYGLMFTGEGGFSKKIPVLSKNHFQTMDLYEFLSDRYVNLFSTHNFGALLFKQGSFQPHIIWHNNFSWGDLSTKAPYEGSATQLKNKVFMETGLQLGNLLSNNSMSLASIGAGVFYRYGPYAHPGLQDNIALKLAFTFALE